MHQIGERYFDWDPQKNIANIKKHGVSFKMAATAFLDPDAVTFEDETHSQNEDRFVLIGINKVNNLLTVCHCFRNGKNVTSIFSAREANSHEKDLYGGDAS